MNGFSRKQLLLPSSGTGPMGEKRTTPDPLQRQLSQSYVLDWKRLLEILAHIAIIKPLGLSAYAGSFPGEQYAGKKFDQQKTNAISRLTNHQR
jgi:hypothetical protein